MQNFSHNFTSDTDFFEMVRRMSEQDAATNAKRKKASNEAVKKLPVLKIEQKHCKKS